MTFLSTAVFSAVTAASDPAQAYATSLNLVDQRRELVTAAELDFIDANGAGKSADGESVVEGCELPRKPNSAGGGQASYCG